MQIDINKITKMLIKMRVDIFLNTISEIQSKCDENTIDCIVKIEQLKNFLIIIKDIGFKKNKKEEIDIENCERYVQYMHLNEFYKYDNGVNICLEVHLTTLYPRQSIYFFIKSNKMRYFYKLLHLISLKHLIKFANTCLLEY